MSTVRALLIVVVGVLLLAVQVAAAQNPLERLVSPGPLARAHEKLEATCNVCHETFNKAGQPAKCLDCHKEVKADVVVYLNRLSDFLFTLARVANLRAGVKDVPWVPPPKG